MSMERPEFKREKYIANAIRYANFYKLKGKSPSISSKDKEEVSIASWRYTQVRKHKEGTLVDEKLYILNRICPYIFEVKRINRDWDEVYNELEQFMSKYLRLPSVTDEGSNHIYSWLRHNVKLYKENKLTEYRVDKLRKILPDKFGGNEEDSVLIKLKSNCDIQEKIGCTPTAEKNLILIGIKSSMVLINLIKERVENDTGCNSGSLAEKVMHILNLEIDTKLTGFVASKIGSQTISTKVNNLMYNTNKLDIALALEIFGVEGLDKNNAKQTLDNIKQYKRIVFDSLTKREKFVMTERYINGKTLVEVGNMWGVSSNRVTQIESKAIRKLRNEPRIQALSGNMSSLLDCLVDKSLLNNVVNLNLTYEDKLNLSYILAKIKKDNNTNCSSNYILGLAYLELLKYDINIDKAIQAAKEIVTDNEKLKKVYDYVFIQSKENAMDNEGDTDREEDTDSEEDYSYYFPPDKAHLELFTYKIKEKLGLVVEGNTEDKKEKEIECLRGYKIRGAGELESITLEDMKISTRPYNCLKRAGCNTAYDILVLLKNDKLSKIKNLGVGSYRDVIEKFKSLLEKED